jgi:hypothetical protein
MKKTEPKLEAVILNGYFTITHKRGDEVLSVTKIHNTATTVGKAQVAGLINGQETNAFKWIALDNSSTAAAAANTALASEITTAGLERAEATCSQTTTTGTDDTARLLHTWTATGTLSVRGCGIFDTSTEEAGTLGARTTFAEKNMEEDDTLEVTYDVKVE